jgi:hypothetical protein
MSPYIDAVVSFLAILFVILGLAPLVDNPPDVTDLAESDRARHSQV